MSTSLLLASVDEMGVYFCRVWKRLQQFRPDTAAAGGRDAAQRRDIMRTRRKISCLAVLPFLIGAAAAPALSQTAPQRSDELCAALQQTAVEQARKFTVTRAGACRVNIDTGYDFFVNYDEQTLHLGLVIDAGLLNGDASALWLRISAFDNLAHAALGTRPQATFDELNKLIKTLAKDALKRGQFSTMFYSKSDKAVLGAKGYADSQIILMASAHVKDIDSMRKKQVSDAAGEVPTWRRILGLSLQAFGSGAQGYANAYSANRNSTQWQAQPVSRAPRTCYTNFIGATAFTNCY
jgi:hypothetical protein